MCAFIDLNNPDVSLIYVTQVCNILLLFCCLNLFYRRKLNLVQSLGKKRFQNTSSYAIKIDIAFDPRAKIHLFICFTSFMKNCKCYIVTHDQICCIRSYQILQSDMIIRRTRPLIIAFHNQNMFEFIIFSLYLQGLFLLVLRMGSIPMLIGQETLITAS